MIIMPIFLNVSINCVARLLLHELLNKLGLLYLDIFREDSIIMYYIKLKELLTFNITEILVRKKVKIELLDSRN